MALPRERIERLRERARAELRHRSVAAGFRTGTLRGAHPRALRAEALATRAASVAGEHLVARDPGAAAPIGAVDVLLGAAALGVGLYAGYRLGQWAKRQAHLYLHGLDVSLH